MNPTRILIADDNALFLGIAVEYLETHDWISIVGRAFNGEDAVTMAKNIKPDVILLDLRMHGLSGLDAIPLIRESLPDVGIISITMLAEDTYRPAALAAGADEFVAKDSMGTHLLPAIRRVINGKPNN
jgi:DNA-binding NarL/FixJ family response regulator